MLFKAALAGCCCNHSATNACMPQMQHHPDEAPQQLPQCQAQAQQLPSLSYAQAAAMQHPLPPPLHDGPPASFMAQVPLAYMTMSKTLAATREPHWIYSLQRSTRRGFSTAC